MTTSTAAWEWTNEPTPFTAADYAAARAWLVDRAAARDDIAAVVEYGHCGTPGLSDIDPIVVLRDRPRADIADWLDRRHWPAAVAAVLDYATLMVMSESGVTGIHFWDDVSMSVLWGVSPLTERIPESDVGFVEGCRVLDWLPWHVMRLRRLERTRQAPVRWTLGLLHSLTYSLRRLETLFQLQEPSWQQFAARVAHLRRSWFAAGPDFAACADLIVDGRAVAEDALAAFCTHVAETPEWYGPYHGAGGRLLVPGTDAVRFGADAGALPVILHRHFSAYARGHGRISTAIAAALQPREDEAGTHLSPGLDRVLRRRMAICDDWAAFLAANHFAAGLFKFAWFYQP